MKVVKLVVFTFVVSICCSTGFSQNIIATYSTSSPEASLFFLNPGTLNPASGSGAIGMFSNPAGLRTTYGRQLSVAFAAPYTSSGQFGFTFGNESDVFEPVYIGTLLDIEETGGLAGIGYAQQFGKWHVGVGMLQASRGGIRFSAQGSKDVTLKFDYEQAITRNVFEDLPVEELPILWNVDTQSTLHFESSPAELYIAVKPVKAAVSYNTKRLSIGAGLTYYRMYSSKQTGRISTEFNSRTRITGTPFGMNPETGEPWFGSISAELDMHDNPITALYEFDVHGHRFEFSVGGMLNTRLLSLGASYANGFRGSIVGEYDISTIVTKGLPQENLFSNIDLQFSNDSYVNGTVSLRLHEFLKDTLNAYDSGQIEVSGYHSISIGAKLLFLGAFVHTKVPKVYPDIMSTHLGLYTDFTIPWTPVRFNFGFIQCLDGIASSVDYMVPYRVTTHVGGGVALRLAFHKWLNFGQGPSWLRFGVRSSLVSYAMDVFERDINHAYDEELPSPLENLSMSVGLDLPF